MKKFINDNFMLQTDEAVRLYHEYEVDMPIIGRILCNILGRDMATGLVPHDFELVDRMVKDISYNNTAEYFGFDL